MQVAWTQPNPFNPARKFRCGHCGLNVGGHSGWKRINSDGQAGEAICLCSQCDKPTYFTREGEQMPGVAFGDEVGHLPAEVASLYDEARNCMAVRAYTLAALGARKLLMNVAVDQGAAEGLRFFEYVEYLVAQGLVPVKAKIWVKKIKDQGNDATHKIAGTTRGEAETVLSFVAMILTLVFDFPARAAAE
jgi:hypothetical protein